MIDEATKKPIQVKTDELAGSSVRVSLGMRDKVVKLFQEHNIPHWAAHQAVSVDGSPMMVFIYLRYKADPQAAQEALIAPPEEARMPAADDIRSLTDRTNRDLDAVHDYVEHSRFVWQSFRDLVDSGHKATTRNDATGTIIDQDGLLSLAPRYTRAYLATFTFRQFVSTFEVFLFEMLDLVLRHNPRQLAKKQLTFETVLDAVDRNEIVSGVIAKHLNELKYETIRAWFDALDKAVHLGCPSDDEIDALAEIKAARDILEHNAGVVNETYLRKSGSMARYVVGDLLEIDDDYHLASWRLIKKVVEDVSTAAVGRLGSS